jgi:hypothetical protein
MTCAAAAIFFAPAVHAAVITIAASPASSGYRATVDIDTQGESVNAVGAHLVFDPNLFTVKAVDTGGSLLDLWVQPPIFSNTSGTIDFSGIVPGGMTTADGSLVTLMIAPRATGTFFGFASTSFQVLLNDGRGTPASVSVAAQPFVFTSLPSSSATAAVSVNLTPPDPFLPQVARDPNIFHGKYFLVFSATDQRSNIVSYQVLEVPTGARGGTAPQWQTATSPYLLRDQTLSSDIYVRAVDASGNFRTVEVPAAHPTVVAAERFPVLAERIGILAVLCLLGWMIWRMRKKRAKRVIL